MKLAADIYGQRLDDNKKIFAKKNLQSIIEKSAIKAISPFGYFNYKVRLERPGRPPKNKLQSAKRVAIHSFILIRPINLSLPVWMQLLFQRIVSE